MNSTKILLVVPYDGHTSMQVLDIVRSTIKSHSFQKATAKLYKGDPEVQSLTEQLDEANARLLEMSAKMEQLTDALAAQSESESRKSVVNTINVVIHAINHISYSMETASQQKMEYMKAGGRQVLRQINEAIREVGLVLLHDAPLPGDDELFVYWIEQAARNPIRVMKAISNCKGAEEYRIALNLLMSEDKAKFSNLDKTLIHEEGGA